MENKLNNIRYNESLIGKELVYKEVEHHPGDFHSFGEVVYHIKGRYIVDSINLNHQEYTIVCECGHEIKLTYGKYDYLYEFGHVHVHGQDLSIIRIDVC